MSLKLLSLHLNLIALFFYLDIARAFTILIYFFNKIFSKCRNIFFNEYIKGRNKND